MIIDLFKKDEINSLKARIAELEEENKRLLLQLGKRDEKTKKSVSAKQEADRELNEARQRLSSLENELAKIKEGSSRELNFHFSESLSRRRLEEVLFLLGSLESKISTLITIYIAKDDALKNLPADIVNQIDSNSLYLIEKIESPIGKAVFYDTNHIIKLVIIPVLPIVRSECALERRFNLGPLKNSLAAEKTLVINAHAGGTFAGVIERDAFVEHEIIRSSVMGKHSKGGWSQKRFQSLVEEDVRHHADKVRAALLPMIEKHRDIQYVIAGGDGKLIKMVMEGYDYPQVIKSMDAQALNAEQVFREVMAVRVYGC